MNDLLNMVARVASSALSPAGPRARLSILLYHRVPAMPDPLLPSATPVQVFDWQMRVVASLFNVLPLSEAVDRLEAGTLPARAACITFDDGYADNAANALAILRHYGLPATFFIASGYLDGGCMWNDRVIEAVRRTPMQRLDLEVLKLGHCSIKTDEERRQAIGRLLDSLKYRDAEERDTVANGIEETAGVEKPRDLMMTRAQLRALHGSGMEIGAHTVTHPILARLDACQARKEIAQSREQLEAIIGGAVNLFAYPNGRPRQDFTAEHSRIVKSLGFKAAVTTAWGAARYGANLYQLPRFTPWDRTPRRFGFRLVQNYTFSDELAH